MLRQFLLVLVYVFFILLVLIPVLLGGYWICEAATDQVGSQIFRVGLQLVMAVLVTDVLLMVGTLGVMNSQR